MNIDWLWVTKNFQKRGAFWHFKQTKKDKLKGIERLLTLEFRSYDCITTCILRGLS